MGWILHQNTQLNLIIKDFIIMFLVSRPCWPSGLSCCSNSSRVASKDPGLNPAWSLHMVPKWIRYTPILLLLVGDSNKKRNDIILLIWVVFQQKSRYQVAPVNSMSYPVSPKVSRHPSMNQMPDMFIIQIPTACHFCFFFTEVLSIFSEQ